MRRYLNALICLGFASLIFSLPSVILAQREEIETEYAWGIVSSTPSGEIVIAEYDFETDEEVNVTYTIDPETEFVGVDSPKDIQVGDSVSIDYVDIGGKKVAKIIDVEEFTEEEEEEEEKEEKEEEEEEPKPSETHKEEPEYPLEEVGY